MADQLCTLAQVKTRLGDTDAADDALLGEYIDQVSDWIQDFTRRKLVPDNAATYLFDTVYGPVLDVPYGIRSVTSMGIAATDQPDAGGSFLAVTASAILLRPVAIERRPGWPATQIVLRSSPIDVAIPFRTAANGATVTGNFGFAATPLRVVGVAIDAVVTAYTDRRSGSSGVIGAEETAIFPWANYFSRGSPQRATLERFREPGMA